MEEETDPRPKVVQPKGLTPLRQKVIVDFLRELSQSGGSSGTELNGWKESLLHRLNTNARRGPTHKEITQLDLDFWLKNKSIVKVSSVKAGLNLIETCQGWILMFSVFCLSVFSLYQFHGKLRKAMILLLLHFRPQIWRKQVSASLTEKFHCLVPALQAPQLQTVWRTQKPRVMKQISLSKFNFLFLIFDK